MSTPNRHRYVALLRGINVGSANRITMAALREVFERLGYENVVTLLQSGNVVFDASHTLGPAATIALEDELASSTGVRARMLLIAAEDFERIADANPLLDVADNPSLMVVTFLGGAFPADVELPAAADLDPERVVVVDDALYQWCPLGVSKSKVPPAFTRKLGAAATARNWRTIERIGVALNE